MMVAEQVVNPLGETVRVDAELLEALRADPERDALFPLALRALADPDEIWSLSGAGATAAVEHRPHLLATTIDGQPEVVMAGTRRCAEGLRLQTWFRAADPRALLRVYRTGARRLHPIREFALDRSPGLDTIYLRPAEPIGYRVERCGAHPSVQAYVADSGLPTLVGLELQDVGTLLRACPRELRRLLSTPCEIDGRTATLREHLRGLQRLLPTTNGGA
jgi:hypothetical protein